MRGDLRRLPGAAQELTPRLPAAWRRSKQFELAGIPHAHAADGGAWALVAAVIIVLSAGLYQAGAAWRPIGFAPGRSAVCPLLAARWEPEIWRSPPRCAGFRPAFL